jgi:hypothetical protein
MAERLTQKFTRKKKDLSENTFPVSPAKKSVHLHSEAFNDEFILTLSQSYENRRAVQAFEWEAIRLSGPFHRGPAA